MLAYVLFFVGLIVSTQGACDNPTCAPKEIDAQPGTIGRFQYGQDDYCNNLNCSTILKVPNYQIHLKFDTFRIETNYDFLTIIDGTSQYGPTVARCTGSNCPAVTSTLGGFTLIFTTDASQNYGQISAEFYSVGNPIGPTSQPTQAPNVQNSTQRWQVAQMLAASINFSANPCQDFYNFGCGGWQKANPIPQGGSGTSTFGSILNGVNQVLTSTLGMKSNGSAPWPAAIQTAVNTYQACVNPTNFQNDLVNTVGSYGGYPSASNFWDVKNAGNKGQIIGDMVSKFGVNTLVTVSTDTNWTHPYKHMLILSEASLTLPLVYYQNRYYSSRVKSIIYGYFFKFANAYAQLTNQSPSVAIMHQDAQQMVNLEFFLANNSLSPTQEINQTSIYNPMDLATASKRYPYLSTALSSLMNTLSSDSGVPTSKFNVFNVQEPSYFAALDQYFAPLGPSGLQPQQLTRLLQNYLMFRLVYANSEFIPNMNELKFGLKRDTGSLTQQDNAVLAASCPNCVQCAQLLQGYMPYAIGRLYIDFHFNKLPNQPRQTLTGMVRDILSSFRLMLSSLPWMDFQTKIQAYAKVNQLVRNVGYPDWQQNNQLLNAHYQALSVSTSDSLWTILLKLNKFSTMFNFLSLEIPTIRSNFNGSPATVNAWYQPELNSITFPAGILNPPFFSAGWPLANLFGAMGVVMGHELTHGFDDSGVQWRADGTLNPWIDRSSNAGFQKMAQCVISEYDHFCYDGPAFNAEKCVNGMLTQGENIADNGGIKAAWLSYKAHQILRGHPEPRLPGVMSQFNNDQLFFLSFSHVWCENTTPQSVESQMLTDVHSPGADRVYGSIQNLPEFAKTFNCPAGQNGNPKKYQTKPCNVW